MLEDYLTLTGSAVTITRKIPSSDGMGGTTTISTIIGLPKAVIWSPSQARSYISQKLAMVSSHVMVTLPSYYSFNIYDETLQYNSQTYQIKGFDDVMNLGEIMVVGLEKIL